MAPARSSRRKPSRSGWWFDVFEEMNRMDRLMEDMMRRAMEMPRGGEEGSNPFVYGFSMSLGPDGKPVIREFGNVEPSAKGPVVREEREPLVDVLDTNGEVVVVTELPGVEKEGIRLESTDRGLKIDVGSGKRRFFKELELPHLVDPRTGRASYKNGVLEVRFDKSSVEKPTRTIKVE